jgi:radical SAM protein with 4Fe4S-binding SPASM domain
MPMATSILSSSSLVSERVPPVEFAWLEITPSCQLHCQHCYAGSRPGLGHGQMSVSDWKAVMSSLAAHGTRFVQFIGGEPTIYPHFCELLREAGRLGLGIEVYSNLVSITTRMWDLFARYQVRVATSFYSENPAVHDAITKVSGSQQKTLANIQKALRLRLRVRVGIVRVSEQQDIAATKRLLIETGVEAERIGVDRTRGVGRGAALIQEDPVSALCGKCVNHRCAVTASGEVYPCIFARSFSLGNVLKEDVGRIITSSTMQETVGMLSHAFANRPRIVSTRETQPCDPDCDPECDPVYYPPCNPDCCPETVADCEPTEPCDPDDE